MPAVLDNLATSFQLLRKSTIIRSLNLADQFETPITPARWKKFEQHLDCPLPALQKLPDEWLWAQSDWDFPNHWTSVADVANHVARHYLGDIADADINIDCTPNTWYDAQVFAGVRETLVDALGVHREDVHRESTLIRDLGAE